jgi:hypothetical protein
MRFYFQWMALLSSNRTSLGLYLGRDMSCWQRTLSTAQQSIVIWPLSWPWHALLTEDPLYCPAIDCHLASILAETCPADRGPSLLSSSRMSFGLCLGRDMSCWQRTLLLSSKLMSFCLCLGRDMSCRQRTLSAAQQSIVIWPLSWPWHALLTEDPLYCQAIECHSFHNTWPLSWPWHALLTEDPLYRRAKKVKLFRYRHAGDRGRGNMAATHSWHRR